MNFNRNVVRSFGAGFVMLAVFIGGAFGQQNAYQSEVAKWRAERETELKSENSWLTVAGLTWLKNGVNTVGAGAAFDVELTDNFKGKFGEINFQNGAATLKIENNVEALSDGVKVSEINLISDEKGKPTVIQIGSQTFYLIKREDRFGIRLKDKNSRERLNFTGLHWFPVDEKLKVTARFEAFDAPKEVLIPNVLGGNFKMKSPGVLKFKLKGKEYALEPVSKKAATNFLLFFETQRAKPKPTARGVFFTPKSRSTDELRLILTAPKIRRARSRRLRPVPYRRRKIGWRSRLKRAKNATATTKIFSHELHE